MDGPGFEPAHINLPFFFDFLGFCLSFFFIHVIAVTLGTAKNISCEKFSSIATFDEIFLTVNNTRNTVYARVNNIVHYY